MPGTRNTLSGTLLLLPFKGHHRLGRQSVIEVCPLPTDGEGPGRAARVQDEQDDRAIGILKSNVLDSAAVERVRVDTVGARRDKLRQMGEHVILNVISDA